VLDGSAEAKLREAAEGDPYDLRLRELRLAKPWMDMLASGTRLVVDFEEWIKKPGCTLAVRLPHRLVGRLIPACRSCCARGQLGAVRLLTTLPARRAPITADARRPGPHGPPEGLDAADESIAWGHLPSGAAAPFPKRPRTTALNMGACQRLALRISHWLSPRRPRRRSVPDGPCRTWVA
jgi:hypothetical protein